MIYIPSNNIDYNGDKLTSDLIIIRFHMQNCNN